MPQPIRTIVLLFAFSFSCLKAQTITGKVKGSAANNPVVQARVIARSLRDTSSKFTTYTDTGGRFSLSTQRGFYVVQILKEGYRPFTGFAKMFRGDTDFGLIMLIDSASSVGEAVIIGKTPPATQKGDTTEYNSGAYKTNPDATAEDLLKKMPGMTVQNGQVTAQGEQVKKVTVDGKEWFGDDAAAVLRNLPADVVDKMQVFDRMSDQSQFTKVDDGTSSKSINIVTKKGMAKGNFGKAYAGYGTSQRYQSGFNFNDFNKDRRFSVLGMANNINQQNFSSQDLLGLSTGSGGGGRSGGGGSPGGQGGYGNYGGMGGQNSFLVQQSNGITTTRAFGINYTDKWGSKTQIAASYFLNSSINDKTSQVYRSYINSLNPEAAQNYLENSKNTNQTLNHRVNLRLTYAFDTSNSLIYTPRFSWQQSDLTQDYSAGYSIKTTKLNESLTKFNNKGSGMNLNNTLLYMHKFHKAGRSFSINFSHEINTKESHSFNDNTNHFYTPLDSAYLLNQNNRLSSPSMKWNTRATYVEPLSKHSFLQAEFAYNYNRFNSQKKMYNFDSGTLEYTKFDSSLSNIFKYHYTTAQYGLMYMYRAEKLQFSVGGTLQQYNLAGDQQLPHNTHVSFGQLNFLPRLMFSYKVNKTASIKAFGRATTNAPSVAQLQNVVDNSNPLLLTTGNPNLRQEVSGFGVVRYSKVNVEKGRNFFIGALGTSTRNYITNSTEFFYKDTQISEGFTAVKGSQITKPVNLKGYYNTRVFWNYGFPIKLIKSNLNFNGAYSYTNTPGLINHVENKTATQNYNLGAVISSNVSEALDFTLAYSGNYYNTQNSYQTRLNNQYYNHTASVKVNWILAKKFVINTDWNYNNYSGLSSGYNQTFMLWNAAVSYKFLKNKAGDLRLSCFDILKQNRSITRTITETYVEDNSTKVLTRYFMLTFTYTLKKFNAPQQQAPANGPYGAPGGMPPRDH